MHGFGCGVSQYPHFFVEDLDMYQVLPRPYLISSDGFPGDKLLKKWALDLASRSDCFWECIEYRTMSDDREKYI